MIPVIFSALGTILGTIVGTYLEKKLEETEWGKAAKDNINSIFSAPIFSSKMFQPYEDEDV